MTRRLTAKTRLDILKKDAKRWLKALRADDPHARNRLAAAWPEAPTEPSLRDVQHALALDYGQESWLALLAALDDFALDRQTHFERVDQLLRHAWVGDVVAARRILARYPEIARDSLFTAAACGDIAEVERRLASDPQGVTRIGGPHGWSALAFVAYGRLDPSNGPVIARLLLDAGADPNFAFDDGWGNSFTLVTGAVRLGEGARPSHPQATELVELLIAQGADPYDPQTLYNVSIVGEALVPPLYWYDLLWRHCEAQDRLGLWRSAEEGLGHSFGLSTLDYLLGNAVGQDEHARAVWLLDRGADPNAVHAYTRRPLHALAQRSGFVALQHLLKERGANRVELNGIDAFHAACRRHDEAAVRALVADDPALLRTPDGLLASCMVGDLASVELLLDLGADVDGVDKDGISPLHRAVQSGSLPLVDRLLSAGADPNVRDWKWQGTALSWAVALGHPSLCARLIPVSRDPRALAKLGALNRLGALLEEEPALANHVLADDQSPTPLYCLPDDEKRAVVIAQMLLDRGADRKIRNANGQTPAAAARARGLDDAADVMERRRHAS